MNLIRIAIDGPGGSGKSTIAKIIAKDLNLDYIDTGAMYRAIALKVSKSNIDIKDKNSLIALLESTEIDFSEGSIFLDGSNVDSLIRTPEVTMMASTTSAIDVVREKLVTLQKNMGMTKSVVMDGRDIGTNVLKEAEYKYYMVASAEERAQRRFKELEEKGIEISFQKVLNEIEERDHNDMTRELNPLKQADDAKVIDTTKMTIEEVVNSIKEDVVNGTSKTV